MEFRAGQATDLPEIAEKLLEAGKGRKVYAFRGSLGSGKTALITCMCRKIGSTDLVTSPTFSLLHHYSYGSNGNIYHFDLYRLKNMEEVLDIGFNDYLEGGDYVFIEWPEKIMKLLPRDCVKVEIEAEGSSRLIKVH